MQIEYTPKQALFLEKLRPYFIGEPRIVGKERVWNLKMNVLADGVGTLKAEALSVGATFVHIPEPRVSIPLLIGEEDQKIDLYLHEYEIEDGGPQPRTKIDINDPKIQELYQSLDKDGQLEACKAYPSPTTSGKYRLRDGHCRRFIIFNLLRRPTLWCVSQKRTEQQCYKDAFIFNSKRNNLSEYDQGHYIQEVLMKRFPESYPNQSTVAKELGIAQPTVSRYIAAYNDLEAQKQVLSPEAFNQATKLSEHTIREIRKAPEEIRTPLFEQAAEKNLSPTQTAKVIEDAKTEKILAPEKIAELTQKIIDKKAETYIEEADNIIKKTDRAREKIVAVGEEYPSELMTAVYGHLSLKGKVSPEKAKAFARDVIDLLVQHAIENKTIDAVMEEADSWQK